LKHRGTEEAEKDKDRVIGKSGDPVIGKSKPCIDHQAAQPTHYRRGLPTVLFQSSASSVPLCFKILFQGLFRAAWLPKI
jgi:hypothetical protein